MRLITKGREPQSLTEHRLSADGLYASLPSETKQELRASLVAEQHGLCCYCNRRIRGDETTKIEHYEAQSARPDLQVSYRNLLAACRGGEGGPPTQQHCDTRRGQQPLTLDPRAPSPHPQRLRFGSDGSVTIDDPTLNRDIDQVLNLNLPGLRKERVTAVATYVDELQRRRGREGTWPAAFLERRLADLENPPEGATLQPHAGAIGYWVGRRLRTASGR